MPKPELLNQRPIFVNGFSRGGTTIFTNLLASHPDICTVSEIHHLFKGQSISDSPWRVVKKCLFNDAPIIVSAGQDFFSPRLLCPRKPLSPRAQRFIDRVLYQEKLRSRHAIFNKFKNRNVEYTRQEISASRLVAKNIDGMIYATDELARMYPDATFIGLVRNGLALCEGHLRRGRSAKAIGERYRMLVDKMQSDAARLPRYRVFRFEDLMQDTVATIRDVYAHAQIDIRQLDDVRMQVRRVMDQNGNHQLLGGLEWEVLWFDLASLDAYFQRDVNSNQIQRLSATDRDTFLKEAGATMEKLGYAIDAAGEDQAILKMTSHDDDRSVRNAA